METTGVSGRKSGDRRSHRVGGGMLLASAITLLAGAPGSHAHAQTRADGLYAEIHTTKGRIVAKLEPDLTPLAVANFVGLSEGTIENAAFDAGRPFYDGTSFHRVAAGHVIQGGVPRSERSNGPGYRFPNEIHARLSHDHAGALNMANSGPHTNAAQFCITLGDRSYLDGDYIVFGDVVEGMDVVMRIVQGDVVDSVRIRRVGAKAEAYRVTTESFRALVRAAEERAAEHDRRKALAELAYVELNWPNSEDLGEGVRMIRVRAGSGARPDGPLRVRYRGTRVRYVGHLLGHTGPSFDVTTFGSTGDGTPDFTEAPAAFAFEPGTTRITPGFDRVVADMTPGERRVAIVAAEAGYGRAGLYRPETPGKPRFVISPNTLLVYEIEMLAAGSAARD